MNSENIDFYLQVFKGLDTQDIISLAKISRTKKLKAGEIYIDENSLSQRIAYIRKGLVRTFTIKANGEDVTLMMRWEDQIIASIDSIIHQQPSRFIHQALEDTILVEIDYKRSLAIIDANPKLSAFRHAFLMQMLSEAMDRIESFVMLPPEERYLKLVNEKPNIINRVPDKYLATLLGVTPVSLSRIRKRIAQPAHH